MRFKLFFGLIIVLLSRNKFSSGKSIALVHVGPPKTGSTWIQTLIYSEISTILEKENFYPVPHKLYDKITQDPSAKGLALYSCLVPELYIQPCDMILEEIKEEISNRLVLKQNIYTSSEAFASKNLNLTKLFDYFTGFEIRVIAEYRERLSWFISIHNTLQLMYLNQPNIDEAFKIGEYRDSVLEKQNFIHLVHRILHHIPESNLFLYDFYGVESTGLDIMEAIIETAIKELSKDSVNMIKQKITMLKRSKIVNHSEDMRIAQLFIHNLKKNNITKENIQGNQRVCFFNSLLPTLDENCKINPMQNQNNSSNRLSLNTPCQSFTSFNICEIQMNKLDIHCVRSSRLLKMRKIAEITDNEVRLKFGNILLYGNITANYETMDKLMIPTVRNHMCELQESSVYADEHLMKIVSDIFDCCFK